MSYSGRHLGFHTIKMNRKNDTLIFLKAYDVFFQNQMSFCFYQKKKKKTNTKLQMIGWLCLTSHRQRGHLETAPPFTVPCEGREAR